MIISNYCISTKNILKNKTALGDYYRNNENFKSLNNLIVVFTPYPIREGVGCLYINLLDRT